MSKTSSKKFQVARFIFAMLAGFVLLPKTIAQDEQPIPERFLFIFSTSAEMKSRLKLTQAELDQLLAFGIKGEMHPGDTLGVWTFDRELHAGQFPMLGWSPDNAAAISDEIDKFIGKQKFSTTNNFKALMPALYQVIASSSRLTVLIFCDGQNQITGTPYDNGINRVFNERETVLKKSHQPFVIVLRTEQGKYAGCTINFPPGMVNVPPFPPLPQPTPPPAATNVQAVATMTTRPLPLVIMGKHVETNWEAYHFAMTNAPVPQTNSVPSETNSVAPTNTPTIAVAKTNSQPNPPAMNVENKISTPTNISPASPTHFVPAPINSPAPTNAVAVSKSSSAEHKGIMALAAGFLIGATVLAIAFIFRSRRPDRSSLITHTMDKK